MNDYSPESVEPVKVHLVRSDLALTDERPPTLKRRGASLRTFTLTDNNPVQQILPLNSRRCEAYIQPAAADLIIATSATGAAEGGGGAAIIPGIGGTSVSAYASATIDASTTVGDVLASIPASKLPAGRYKIDAYSYMSDGTTPTILDAMAVSVGGTAIARMLSYNAVNSSSAFQPKQAFTVYAQVDGTQAIAVTAAAVETGTNEETFNIVLVATQERPQTGPVCLNTTDPIWATSLVLPTTVSVMAVIEET